MSTVQENGMIATPTAPTPRDARVVEDHGPLAYMMDTARFEHCLRLAKLLGSASLTPQHLIGKSNEATMGNCFQVVNQALRWGMDMFAVAAETYVVGNKLGYQGKLVAAVINARANLEGNLRFEHSGAGAERKVVVIGRIKGEQHDRIVEATVKQCKTANKIWESDPDQKLCYTGATKWARRHCPEVMLGILTDDDLEVMADNGAIASNVQRRVGRSSLNDVMGIEVEPPVYVHKEPEAIEDHIPDAGTMVEHARELLKPIGPTAEQLETLANELDMHLSEAADLAAVEKCRKWAKEKYVGTPSESLSLFDGWCDQRAADIKDKRGEKSNKAQKDLIQ